MDNAPFSRELEEKKEVEELIRKIARIRSGGQTGADRGALDAALDAEVTIAGWCPKGGRAEDFEHAPGLLMPYPQLVETPSSGYVQRTAWNVRDSHATLIVAPDGLEPESGTQMTVDFAQDYDRPVLVVAGMEDLAAIREWLATLEEGITLNVAGPRASKCMRAYDVTFEIIAHLLAFER